MQSACSSVLLTSLGVLRAQGAGARSFLQGQLSNDLTLLDPRRALHAGYHNPQGRVIALLRLVERSADELLAIMPRELIPVVAQRLGKFILRAKVKLSDVSAAWTIAGVIGADAASLGEAWPAPLDGAARIGGSLVVRVAAAPARWLLVSPADAPTPPLPAKCTPVAAGLWQRLAIGGGEPQVYQATCEEFVAQMLNLDVLGTIAFDKGCYTGQEVIARAHYRGRVKRRMQHFVTRERHTLVPGAGGVLGDGRTFRVVDAVQLPDGRCEFLAVTPLAAGQAASGEAPAEPRDAGSRIDAEQLTLPYALPDEAGAKPAQ